eukprot:TRINITY_DN3043_c1_g1_i2.p1 TRINITY_DN3043_c1_g1~~TRINITY_DN3043_c1_g1_i2.p1  ORF type:complete len:641 (+),score=220.70 TRINITY_DN3043_c1_g1_i2:72-1925(+)
MALPAAADLRGALGRYAVNCGDGDPVLLPAQAAAALQSLGLCPARSEVAAATDSSGVLTARAFTALAERLRGAQPSAAHLEGCLQYLCGGAEALAPEEIADALCGEGDLLQRAEAAALCDACGTDDGGQIGIPALVRHLAPHAPAAPAPVPTPVAARPQRPAPVRKEAAPPAAPPEGAAAEGAAEPAADSALSAERASAARGLRERAAAAAAAAAAPVAQLPGRWGELGEAAESPLPAAMRSCAAGLQQQLAAGVLDEGTLAGCRRLLAAAQGACVAAAPAGGAPELGCADSAPEIRWAADCVAAAEAGAVVPRVRAAAAAAVLLGECGGRGAGAADDAGAGELPSPAAARAYAQWLMRGGGAPPEEFFSFASGDSEAGAELAELQRALGAHFASAGCGDGGVEGWLGRLSGGDPQAALAAWRGAVLGADPGAQGGAGEAEAHAAGQQLRREVLAGRSGPDLQPPLAWQEGLGLLRAAVAECGLREEAARAAAAACVTAAAAAAAEGAAAAAAESAAQAQRSALTGAEEAARLVIEAEGSAEGAQIKQEECAGYQQAMEAQAVRQQQEGSLRPAALEPPARDTYDSPRGAPPPQAGPTPQELRDAAKKKKSGGGCCG